MLMLKSPSLVINSHDVPWPRYRMWETVNAPPRMNAEGCVREIIRVNRLALEYERTPLQNVVINCHGAEGGGALNIGTIWLVACQAAAGHFGKKLCQAIASLSGSQVVAADEDQDVGVWGTIRIIQGGGRGQIDEFEGDVYSFVPIGGPPRKIDPHEAIYTILE